MRSQAVKRGIDILGSIIGLVLAAPPLALVAVAIRRSMGPPVLFRQERIGRDGLPFELCKLRTMRDGPGPDEDRITPLGARLRRTSIDEVPELWNVLKGEMSLVGPRPLLPRYLPRYSAAQARRHEVRPGLTGLAQVSGRNDLSWERRLELDVAYVDQWTIGGDLRLLARTAISVLRRDGITAEGHATMPEFLGTSEGPR